MPIEIKELEIRVRVGDASASASETVERPPTDALVDRDGEIEAAVRRAFRRLRDPEER